jgi:hypothetical protein
MAFAGALTRRLALPTLAKSAVLLRSRGPISCGLNVRYVGDYRPRDADRAKYDLPDLVEGPKEDDTPKVSCTSMDANSG